MESTWGSCGEHVENTVGSITRVSGEHMETMWGAYGMTCVCGKQMETMWGACGAYLTGGFAGLDPHFATYASKEE